MSYINWFNLISFLLILITSIYSYLKKDNKKSPFLTKILNDKEVYTVMLILLFVIAFCIRSYSFGQIPMGVNQDEAMAGYEAKSLSMYGMDRFGMSWPVYFTAWEYAQMNVLESICMIPFIKLFGLTASTIRIPMLILSMVSIFALYDFSKRIFGKNPALIILFFITINPWHIMISRWALESNFFPMFLLISIYLLYLGITKNKLFLYLSMVFFGLTMYSYATSYFTVPLLLLIFVILLLRKKYIRVSDAIICSIVYFAISFPIFLMIFINLFKLETINIGKLTIPFFESQTRTGDLLVYADNLYQQGVKNFYALLSISFFQLPDHIWNYIEHFGPLYLFSIPVLILGFWELNKNELYDKKGVYLINIWLIISIFAGIMVNEGNTNQLNIIFFPFIIFCGIGIYRLLFSENTFKISIPIIIIYIVSFALFTNTYFSNYKNDSARVFYYGFKESLENAQNYEKDSFYITAFTQGQGSYRTSEILTLFHLDIDSLYFQNKTESDILYGDKYRYINFYEWDDFENPDTVYIFNREEEELFNIEAYDVNYFGDYATAIYKE